jgi:hypothetical protein
LRSLSRSTPVLTESFTRRLGPRPPPPRAAGHDRQRR